MTRVRLDDGESVQSLHDFPNDYPSDMIDQLAESSVADPEFFLRGG